MIENNRSSHNVSLQLRVHGTSTDLHELEVLTTPDEVHRVPPHLTLALRGLFRQIYTSYKGSYVRQGQLLDQRVTMLVKIPATRGQQSRKEGGMIIIV